MPQIRVPRPWRVAPLAALVLCSASVEAGQGTLRNRVQTVLWSGTVAPGDLADIPECAGIPCERFDPDGLIKEADESNNCGSVYVRLKDVDLPSRSAELLGPGPACRN